MLPEPMTKNHPQASQSGQKATKTAAFALILGLFVGCSVLQAPRSPTPEEALEGLKNACVLADLTPNLPEEAQKACDLVEKLEIKAASDVE